MNGIRKARKIKDRDIPQDFFITPKHIVKEMIGMTDIKETDIVLDPCYGEGAFYEELPKCIKYYCEISKNKDFYDFNEPVDVIIGNPPFSQFDKWIEKTISLRPKKICYLFGCINLTPNRLKRLYSNGYFITKLVFVRITGYFGHSYLCLLERDKEPIVRVL